jgi:hypothetical protein
MSRFDVEGRLALPADQIGRVRCRWRAVRWMMFRFAAGSPMYASKAPRSPWIVSLPYASMIAIVVPVPSNPLSRSDWKP